MSLLVRRKLLASAVSVTACVFAVAACCMRPHDTGREDAEEIQPVIAIATTRMRVDSALKKAIDALEAKNLIYSQEFELRAGRSENGWMFWFVFQPVTPGLDISAYVADDGQITVVPNTLRISPIKHQSIEDQ